MINLHRFHTSDSKSWLLRLVSIFSSLKLPVPVLPKTRNQTCHQETHCEGKIISFTKKTKQKS